MAEELELVKISELPDASNVTSTDVMPIVQNGITKKVTAPIIRKYVVDSLGSAAKASTSDFEPSGSVLEVDLKSQERADEQNKRIDRIEVAAYLLRNNKIFKAYRSKVLMLADVANIPANSLVHVVNDPANNAETNDINGQYHYDGNDFLKLPDGFLDLINEKSDQVLESSKSYTDGRITSLQQTAATDASTKATAAKDDAIHTAAIDAQLKADDAEKIAKNYTNEKFINFNSDLNNVRDFILSTAEKIETITMEGTYKYENLAFLRLDAVAADSTQYPFLRVLNVNNNGFRFGRVDKIENGSLISFYEKTSIDVTSTQITLSKNTNRVSFVLNAIYDDVYISGSLAVCVYDEDRVIPGITETAAANPSEVSVFMHSGSGNVALAVPIQVLQNEGVDLADNTQMVNWIRSKYPLLNVRYRQKTTKTIENYFSDLSDEFVITHIDTDYSLSVFGKNSSTNTDLSSVVSVNNDSYTQFSVSVTNTSKMLLKDELVELKINFPMGLVYSDEQLIVRDNLFNEYACQFCPDLHVNFRKEKSEGYYADGSFKSGSIYIYDTLEIDEIKRYKIYAYGSKVKTSKNPLSISVGTTVDLFTLYGMTIGFANTAKTDGILLTTIGKDDDSISVLSYPRFVSKATTTAAINFEKINSRRIIAKGEIFTDIIFDVTNKAYAGYSVDEDIFKASMLYRVFSNGLIKIKAIYGVNEDIPALILFGMYQQLNLSNYTADAYTYDTQYRHFRATKNQLSLDVIYQFAQGDLHREGTTYGPTRPPIISIVPTSTSFSSAIGWRYASTTTPTWDIEKGYVWYSETNILVKNTVTNSKTLVDKLFNTPTGFCGDVGTTTIQTRKLLNILDDLVITHTDFLYSEILATSSGSHEYRVFDAELYKFVKHSEGDFDDIYSRFIQMLSNRFGSDLTQIGAKWTNGTLLLQFESRYTTPALCWLYHEAVVRDDTAKISTLKIITKSLTDAFKQYSISHPNIGLPLTGDGGSGGGNSNSIGSSMRIIALGIKMGIDTDNSLLDLYESLENNLVDTGTFMPVLNYVNESRTTGDRVLDRYLHYIMYALNGYVQASLLLNRQPIFSVSQYTLNAFNANGDPRDHQWCRSESRRGIRGTIGFALMTLVNSRQEGLLNGAIRLAESIQRNSFDNEAKPKRCLDFYYILSKQGTETVGNEISFNIHSMCDVLFNYHYGLLK